MNINDITDLSRFKKESIDNKTVLINKEQYDELKQTDIYKNNFDEIPEGFLIKSLNDDNFFQHLSDFFKGKLNSYLIGYKDENNQTKGRIFKKKISLYLGLNYVLDKYPELFDEEAKIRLIVLESCIEYNLLKNKYIDKLYSYKVDGENYTVNLSGYFNLLDLPFKRIKQILESTKIETINNIPKDKYIYGLTCFFTKKDVLYNYIIPNDIYIKLFEIANCKYLDIEAFNKFKTVDETLYEDIEIDSTLYDNIMSDMPEELSKIEKAIYIYIKMCKLFSYDEEYYAFDQVGPFTFKHLDPKYINCLNKDNKELVCFEFNLIYAKLLSEIGINFKSNYINYEGEKDYGLGHANLTFRVDKYLILADSVTSVLNGDLMQAKYNQPLFGLCSLNKNINTQNKFKDEVSKVYKLIAKQENEDINKVEHTETYQELLDEFDFKNKDVSFYDKIKIISNKVLIDKNRGIDNLSYLMQLRYTLFSADELENNFKVIIIKDVFDLKKDREAKTSAIICLNPDGFGNDISDTKYFYYTPGKEFRQVQRQTLLDKFDTYEFAFIEKNKFYVPGILLKDGLVKIK